MEENLEGGWLIRLPDPLVREHMPDRGGFTGSEPERKLRFGHLLSPARCPQDEKVAQQQVPHL